MLNVTLSARVLEGRGGGESATTPCTAPSGVSTTRAGASEFPADLEESAEPGESEVQPLSRAVTIIPTEVRARVIREWGRLRLIVDIPCPLATLP